MILPAIAFYLFAIVTVMAGILVITARNPVHSVLYLILAFFNAAGLFVLLGAEFLAMILVIVYVGAVAVLFLFVVMMLDTHAETLKRHMKQNIALGLCVGLVLMSELITIAGGSFVLKSAPTPMVDVNNTKALGLILYTKYAYIFEISGLVLFVAMIGAIVLTLRHRPGIRRQKISVQIARSRAETVELVKVKSGEGI